MSAATASLMFPHNAAREQPWRSTTRFRRPAARRRAYRPCCRPPSVVHSVDPATASAPGGSGREAACFGQRRVLLREAVRVRDPAQPQIRPSWACRKNSVRSPANRRPRAAIASLAGPPTGAPPRAHRRPWRSARGGMKRDRPGVRAAMPDKPAPLGRSPSVSLGFVRGLRRVEVRARHHASSAPDAGSAAASSSAHGRIPCLDGLRASAASSMWRGSPPAVRELRSSKSRAPAPAPSGVELDCTCFERVPGRLSMPNVLLCLALATGAPDLRLHLLCTGSSAAACRNSARGVLHLVDGSRACSPARAQPVDRAARDARRSAPGSWGPTRTSGGLPAPPSALVVRQQRRRCRSVPVLARARSHSAKVRVQSPSAGTSAREREANVRASAHACKWCSRSRSSDDRRRASG
jgi:hypothetical protein